MQSYDMANIINGLYEQLVKNNDRFSSNQGIYFCCQLDCQCHGYETEYEGHEKRDFHIIILNHHQVFTCTTDSGGLISEIPSPEKFKNKSNHISCWRNVASSELTHLMFEVHDKAFENCPENLRPSTKSQEVRFSLRTSLYGPIFKYIEVEKAPDYETDDSGYHKKLTSIMFFNY